MTAALGFPIRRSTGARSRTSLRCMRLEARRIDFAIKQGIEKRRLPRLDVAAARLMPRCQGSPPPHLNGPSGAKTATSFRVTALGSDIRASIAPAVVRGLRRKARSKITLFQALNVDRAA